MNLARSLQQSRSLMKTIPRLSQRFPQYQHQCRRTFGVVPSAPLRIRKPLFVQQLRYNSNDASNEHPLTDRAVPAASAPSSEASAQAPSAEEIAERKAQEPAYQMTFTCRKCVTRSSHRITKQAYHFGTTLITCPGCKNRHLISDHLKIFSDRGITIEDILKEKGELLRKGRLGEDGDVEFYDDEATKKVNNQQGGNS